MRILISAYACNPYGGSEPGVGWSAVCRIARSHDVWVLTDIHNKPGWDKGYEEGLIPSNLRVRYVRDRASSIRNSFIAHIDSWLSYAAYNRLVLDAAAKWHEEVRFDLCHQVTIAAWRMPSPLWRLPIPFVWGPLGGAGYIPPAFRSMLSPSARLFERARDFQTMLASRSSAFRSCILESAVVLAANEETELFLRPYRRDRPMFRLPVASFSQEKVLMFRNTDKPTTLTGPLRLFAGGNMEGRKGLNLALRALALIKQQGIEFHYTIGGDGPDIPATRALATRLELDDMISFHPGFRGNDYVKILRDTDVYFLPSFRETMGMTLVEAIFAGCYPVVADISAQGEIVRLAGGKAVPVDNMEDLIAGLADALTWCARHREELPQLASEAAALVEQYCSSERYDATLEEAYRSAVNGRNT